MWRSGDTRNGCSRSGDEWDGSGLAGDEWDGSGLSGDQWDDSELYGIGVNISERKSGTEQTKKSKKLELVFFTTRGASGTVVHRLDAIRIFPELHSLRGAIATRDILIPGPMRPLLSQNWQNTHHFTILHSELALSSTESWLPSRLSST